MEEAPKPTPPRSPSPQAVENRRLRKINKEQLALALKKKRICNNKAQKVVIRLLEPIDDIPELLTALRDINQSHYDDIVDERAIMMHCGYPPCKEALEEIPKQQYHISVATKTVYDLTERKNFCSFVCMRASNYIRIQLLTSPLWMRDQEIIPEFKILNK
ncbi:unnamed protein product [Diamesa hyperborea]